MRRSALFILIIAAILTGCENKALHDSEEFKPREIHERIEFHFDRIKVDGVEYLILEKDNNNPHEGFGFMAFRANKLIEKQDTLLAYLKTVTQMQELLYARTYGVPLEKAKEIKNELLEENLSEFFTEIQELEEHAFSSDLNDISPPDTVQNEEGQPED